MGAIFADSGVPWGVAVVGGGFAMGVAITLLWALLFPHTRIGRGIRWMQGWLAGEPPASPYMLIAPAFDATPRSLLTVVDLGGTVDWDGPDGVVTQIDQLVRIGGPGPEVMAAVSPPGATPRAAFWLMMLAPQREETLLRQLNLVRQDRATIDTTWWAALPYRILNTEPFRRGPAPR